VNIYIYYNVSTAFTELGRLIVSDIFEFVKKRKFRDFAQLLIIKIFLNGVAGKEELTFIQLI